MPRHVNRAELLVNGDAILPSLLSDIGAAQRTIHVSIFLWFRDPIGEEIADALLARATESPCGLYVISQRVL